MRVLLAAAVLLGVGVRAAKFKTAGLKRIDLGLQDAKDLKLAAFCDFNSDKLVRVSRLIMMHLPCHTD